VADVKRAIDFVIASEDRSMSGKVTTLKGDNGGATRFGIASKFHPELRDSGFFDAHKMLSDEALKVAEQVYTSDYAAPLHIDGINDQKVATALLSFGVNSGISRAAQLLQQACVRHNVHVDIDGKIGPYTLTAVNQTNPSDLLETYIDLAKNYYRDLAETHPNDARFLHGWENRADEWNKA
jgi:lysozyme family protein